MKRLACAVMIGLCMAGAAWAGPPEPRHPGAGGPLPASCGSGPAVYFTGEIGANPDLYRIDLESMKAARLTTASSAEMQPAVTADGKTIAFVSDAGGASSLYVMQSESPEAPWKNFAIGMGAYAHPAFSPDGTQIAVGYAPDPEAPLMNTCLAIVDVNARMQKIVLEGKDVLPGYEESAGPILVLDRPQWLDATNLVFAALEYADAESGRLTSATLFRMNLSDKIVTRLAGGESYFDEKGVPRGFKASVPWCAADGKLITFSAIQGHLDRTPMSMAADAKNKRVLPIKDQDYWGPAIQIGGEYLYGYRDDEGRLRLALTTNGGKGPRRVLPFDGTALDPVVISQ